MEIKTKRDLLIRFLTSQIFNSFDIRVEDEEYSIYFTQETAEKAVDKFLKNN